MKSAITVSLVPEANGGPFVFWDDLPAAFAKAAKLGFDAIEIFPPSAEDLDARQIKALCQEYNLKVAAIGTGAGAVKHKLRLTDPDPKVRRRAQEFIAAIIDFAGAFGAPAILGSMQGRWGDGVSREQALAWLAEALEQLGPRAYQHGVPFLYEFLNRYETNLFNRIEDSLAFIAPLRTRNVKLLADLFHMNIEESDLAAAIRQAGPMIAHVHFADSNRRAIGLGHTSMAPIIEALKDIGYASYLSAEIFPFPDSDQAAAQTIKAFKELCPR